MNKFEQEIYKDGETYYHVKLHSPYNHSILITKDLKAVKPFIDNYLKEFEQYRREIFVVKVHSQVIRSGSYTLKGYDT